MNVSGETEKINWEGWEEFEKEMGISFHGGKKREHGKEYCSVIVINGYFEKRNDTFDKKWYWMLENHEVFCQIYRTSYGRIEFFPCRITGTKIFSGRSIDSADCIII